MLLRGPSFRDSMPLYLFLVKKKHHVSLFTLPISIQGLNTKINFSCLFIAVFVLTF